MLTNGAFPLCGTTLFGTASYGTSLLGSGRFAFPLQFSTALEWAGLFSCRYRPMRVLGIYPQQQRLRCSAAGCRGGGQGCSCRCVAWIVTYSCRLFCEWTFWNIIQKFDKSLPCFFLFGLYHRGINHLSFSRGSLRAHTIIRLEYSLEVHLFDQISF